jgi:hypothetical protein
MVRKLGRFDQEPKHCVAGYLNIGDHFLNNGAHRVLSVAPVERDEGIGGLTAASFQVSPHLMTGAGPFHEFTRS